MKLVLVLSLVLFSGCAMYLPVPHVEADQDYYGSPMQGSGLTSIIQGVNLYRNISHMNSSMIRSELRARADAMTANPSELFNPLY